MKAPTGTTPERELSFRSQKALLSTTSRRPCSWRRVLREVGEVYGAAIPNPTQIGAGTGKTPGPPGGGVTSSTPARRGWRAAVPQGRRLREPRPLRLHDFRFARAMKSAFPIFRSTEEASPSAFAISFARRSPPPRCRCGPPAGGRPRRRRGGGRPPIAGAAGRRGHGQRLDLPRRRIAASWRSSESDSASPRGRPRPRGPLPHPLSDRRVRTA